MRTSVLAWLLGVRLALVTANTAGRIVANYPGTGTGRVNYNERNYGLAGNAIDTRAAAAAVSVGSEVGSVGASTTANATEALDVVGPSGSGEENPTEAEEVDDADNDCDYTGTNVGTDTNPRTDAHSNRIGTSVPVPHSASLQSKSQTSSQYSSSSYRRCPLCMDNVQRPTATPCGHVYCWKCIVRWSFSQDPLVGRDRDGRRGNNTSTAGNLGGANANNTGEASLQRSRRAGGVQRSIRQTQNESEGANMIITPTEGTSSGGHVRCPVCRHTFHTQSIRCLFGYA